MEGPPRQYDTEFLLYQLTDGDGTKREYFARNWTMEDALLWFLLSRYDAWAKQKQIEKR